MQHDKQGTGLGINTRQRKFITFWHRLVLALANTNC